MKMKMERKATQHCLFPNEYSKTPLLPSDTDNLMYELMCTPIIRRFSKLVCLSVGFCVCICPCLVLYVCVYMCILLIGSHLCRKHCPLIGLMRVANRRLDQCWCKIYSTFKSKTEYRMRTCRLITEKCGKFMLEHL